MKVELEIVHGEVHDSIVAKLNWMGKVYASKCSPEMGHITEAEATRLFEIFRVRLEENLQEMIQRDFDSAVKGEATK